MAEENLRLIDERNRAFSEDWDRSIDVAAESVVVAGDVSLTGKAWSLILTTVLTLVFLILIVPFSTTTLANRADPTFWVFISGIPILVLLALFAILSWLNVKTGIANRPYLASPRSAGGLLTVAVVGFASGACWSGTSRAA